MASYFYCILMKLTTNLEQVLSIMPCNIKAPHVLLKNKNDILSGIFYFLFGIFCAKILFYRFKSYLTFQCLYHAITRTHAPCSNCLTTNRFLNCTLLLIRAITHKDHKLPIMFGCLSFRKMLMIFK